MYTLRTVAQSGAEANCEIGKRYRYVDRNRSGARFESLYKLDFGKDAEIPEHLIGYVESESGTMYPISSDERTYIMSESGATFCRLS